jgi:hypothetical protein
VGFLYGRCTDFTQEGRIWNGISGILKIGVRSQNKKLPVRDGSGDPSDQEQRNSRESKEFFSCVIGCAKGVNEGLLQSGKGRPVGLNRKPFSLNHLTVFARFAVFRLGCLHFLLHLPPPRPVRKKEDRNRHIRPGSDRYSYFPKDLWE